MALWKPSTRDDEKNARREFRRMKRAIAAANSPSGSSVFDATTKMAEIEEGEGMQFPIGCVLWMTSSTNPSNLGCRGTWTLKTKAFVPLTDDTVYYLFERTA